MFKALTAWIQRFKDDMALASYHATADTTGISDDQNLITDDLTVFDIYWHNEDGKEVTKRIHVPRTAVGAVVQQMLTTEMIEVGDTIQFKLSWPRK